MKRIRRIGWWIAVPVAVFFVATLLRERRPAAEYQRRLEALRARGEPTRVAELGLVFPVIPPERDFGLFLERVIPGYDAEISTLPMASDEAPYDEIRTGVVRAGWSPAWWERLEATVRSNAPVIEPILAQDLDGFGFSPGVTEGPRSVLPPRGDRVFDRITLFKALSMQAAYEAEKGDSGRAVRALERGYQVARVQSTLGMISGIGRAAGEAMLLPAVEQVLNRMKLEASDLERLARVLPRTTELLEQTLVSERVQILTMAEVSVAELAPEVRERNLRGFFLRMMVATRGYGGRLRMLEHMNRMVAASRRPPVERLVEAAAIDAEWTRERANPLRQLQAWVDFDYRMLHLLQPRISQLFHDDLATQCRLAAARAAVAVEFWRRGHGERIPESLEVVAAAGGPPVPPDPSRGAPLRFRRVGDGYRIYAGTWDREPDGGTNAPAQPGGASGYDVVFSVDR